MINQPPPKLSPQRPIRSDFHKVGPSYMVRRFITIAVLVLIVGFIAHWFFGHSAPVNPEDIPVIKSEGAYKQRPEQPGGIDIPHQDMQVYQELDNKNNDKAEVEHLLPPPEVPQAQTPPSQAGTPQATDIAPQAESLIASTPTSNPVPPTSPAQVESMAPAASVPVEPPFAAQPITQSAILPTTVTGPATPAVSQPVPVTPLITAVTPPAAAPPVTATKPVAPSIVVAPKPATSKATKTANDNLTIEQILKNVEQPKPVVSNISPSTPADGGTAIQLASVPDQTSAQQLMQKLQSKYASELGGVELHLVRADLGSKGIYYRIQALAPNETQARSICSKLKSLNAGCILVNAR